MRVNSPISALPAFVAAGLIAGCASHRYIPTLPLGPSPATIGARAEVREFVNTAPAGETESGLRSDVTPDVRNALITDFQTNRVFSEVGEHIHTPDILIKGEIRRFYARSGATAFGWISLLTVQLLAYTGIPMYYSEGAVEISLIVLRPDGGFLGQYVGRSDFSDSWSVYTQFTKPAGVWDTGLIAKEQLDRAFAQAVTQIRDQMLRDYDKLSAKPTSPAGVTAKPDKTEGSRRWDY